MAGLDPSCADSYATWIYTNIHFWLKKQDVMVDYSGNIKFIFEY